MAQHHDTKQNLLQFIETKSQTIIVLSSFFILFGTLAPFDFTYPDNFSWDDFKIIMTTVSPPGDILVNLALFMPFGLGLTALFTARGIRFKKSICLTFIFGFCFSSIIEFLQILSLLRMTTPTDIASNTFSGFLGGVFFLLIRNRAKTFYFKFNKRIFSRIFMVTWLIYLLVISISLISFQDATKLGNWNTQFPLMMGNERTGNRPWKGEMSYFYISDRVLSDEIIGQLFTTNSESQTLQDNLLGAYVFNKLKLKYVDRLGNLPNLIWQAKDQEVTEKSSITLDNNNWLETEILPEQATKKIQNNAQFTIITKIKNSQKKIPGESRIFSLSKNLYQRNLSFEQSEADLKLRLRTPVTGNNGKNPELIWRDFFDAPKFHQIAIAYNGKELKFYIDNIANIYNLKLNSEAALFWSILSFLGSKTPIYINKSSLYNFLYHDLLFIPFGLLLSLILIMLPKNRIFYLLILFSGIMIPSLLIESIVVITNNGTEIWGNVFVSILTIAITSLLFKNLITLEFKNKHLS